MSIYTIKMNILDNPKSFQYCKENGIIGIGWGLINTTEKPKTISEYKTLRTVPITRQLSIALNHMEHMNSGDYVWTVDAISAIPTYYLCVLESSYEYFSKEIQDDYGIANGFRCRYNAITSEKLIPSSVIRYLNGNGLIYEIRDTNDITATESIAIAISSIAEGK